MNAYYANDWVDNVIASQFSINFVHINDEKPIFHLWESKTCLISTLNKMQNNVCSDIFWYGDMLLHVWAKKMKMFKILYTKYMKEKKREAMTSSTH